MEDAKKDRQQIGSEGETQAHEYLKRKGYRWRASNFRTRWGEIDLVMEDGSTLVFVEVKRRLDQQFGPPEETITRAKRRHMTMAALLYVQTSGLTGRMMRFDVVTLSPAGVHHHRNAFAAAGAFYY